MALPRWFPKQMDFEPWRAPDWQSKSVPECLEELRIYVEKQAGAEIGWYARNIRGARRASRWLRMWALLFTALGGLVPILQSVNVLQAIGERLLGPDTAEGIQLGQLGYLCLALAGSFALFDRFFGHSTAWMRYVTTMIGLEKLREGYRIEWAGLARRFQVGQDPEFVARMLDLSKTFIVQMKEQTEKETMAWVNEFQTNLSQFEKDLRAQLEAGRPGGIDVRVTDGRKAPAGVQLALDQMVVETITGTSGSIGYVPPGLHKVAVSATVQGTSYASSQMVTVPPAGVVKMEFTLGIP